MCFEAEKMLNILLKLFLCLLAFSSQSVYSYQYDAHYYNFSNESVEPERIHFSNDGSLSFYACCENHLNDKLCENTRVGSFFTLLGDIDATKSAAELTKSQLKGIKSLEKQIQKHQQKLDDFKANPTVRPGMENLPKDVIKRQQEARIKHLETEINTFKNNIEKIKNGDL